VNVEFLWRLQECTWKNGAILGCAVIWVWFVYNLLACGSVNCATNSNTHNWSCHEELVPFLLEQQKDFQPVAENLMFIIPPWDPNMLPTPACMKNQMKHVCMCCWSYMKPPTDTGLIIKGQHVLESKLHCCSQLAKQPKLQINKGSHKHM
jgi:hypothetical protein